MPAPYDYSSASGYARARPDWADFPATTTPIQQTHLDRIDQALFDKKSEVFNVKDFGALGDDATTDTTAFSNAITTAGVGATLLVPAGTYRISSSLTMLTGQRMVGVGVHDTILKHMAGANPLIICPNESNVHSLFGFSDLQITAGTGTGIGIRFGDSAAVTTGGTSRITRCFFNAVPNYAVAAYGHLQLVIRDSVSDGCRGVLLGDNSASVGCNKSLLQGNYFQDGTTNPLVDISANSNACAVWANVLESESTSLTGSGLRVLGGFGHSVKSNWFENNTGTQLSFAGSASEIVGNSFYGTTTTDMTVTGSRNDVEGNLLQTGTNTISGAVCRVTGNTVFTPATLSVTGGLSIQRNNRNEGTTYIDGQATVASSATIAVPASAELVNVTGTTTITGVTAGYAGQRVTLKFAGALTFTDGSNLVLAGNLVTTADDTISLICDGTNWIETSRSVN
jgi:hypothetical protein